MVEQGDLEEFEAIFDAVNFTEWIFTSSVKNEQVNDEPRLKCTINRMKKVDYSEEAKHMLEAIQKINAQ